MASVLVPLAEGSEELEATTIVDLLRRAGIEVTTAGLAEGPIKASRGMVLLPDTTLDAVLEQNFDMIALPGGLPGSDHFDSDPRIHQLLKRLAAQGSFVAAICAAPKVLARAGLLNGKRATCYPGVLDRMKFPLVGVKDLPVVVDGNVITGRGPGTAMDFALQLIESLVGSEKRDEVEEGLVR